jgi:hypothetical protein
VGEDGNRSLGALYGGNLTPDSYTFRWEGDPSSPYAAPSEAFWEVTLFSDQVIQLVTGNCFTGGTSEISIGAWSEPYTLAQNSSWVFLPVNNGNYKILSGSYS